MKEYLYAYVMSREDIKKVVSRYNPAVALPLLAIALLIISVPAKQHAAFFQDYAYNFLIIGFSVIVINALMSALIAYFTRGRVYEIMFGLLHMTATAFIINSAILALLYLMGMPFGVSSILWAAAATLLSTYYFIVLLAVCSGSIVGEENKKAEYTVEIAALMLWYVFTFYILPLTI